MMKLILALGIVVWSSGNVFAEEKTEDEIEMGLRNVFTVYKKGDKKEALERMRALVKLMEAKSADAVAELLPEEVGEWKGETMKKEDLSIAGGGVSISRVYVDAEKNVTVKVIKDAPVIKPLIAMLGNKELLALSGRKTSRISGEVAVMEGERKLQMVLDERIFVELVGNAASDERDLVSLVRKLDLRAISKL